VKGEDGFNWQGKSLENHAAAVALHFIHYNFARIYKTLRLRPRWMRDYLTTLGTRKGSRSWPSRNGRGVQA